MMRKTYMCLAIFLAMAMVGTGLFVINSFSGRDEVSLATESGGKIGLGIDLDENTRADLRPDEIIDGDYIPQNWDVAINHTFAESITMESHPVGHADSEYGDVLYTAVTSNLTLSLNFTREPAGSNITNMSINWGDGSGNTQLDGDSYADVLTEEFTHNYTDNGTYTLQVWLWHYEHSPKSYTWTYGAWPVIVCDGFFLGYANYSDTGKNLVHDDGTFPLQYSFNDSVVFQMPRGTDGIYNYNPTTGLPYEGEEAYTDDKLAEMVYLALARHTDMFRMIDSTFLPTGEATFVTLAFNADESTINMWKADGVAIDPIEVEEHNNLEISDEPVMADTMSFTNVTDGIQNATLTLYNEFANAWGFAQYDYQDYSDQIRPIIDLYIAIHGGGTTTDQEITADEAEFAESEIDEDFVEDWLGGPIPTTSSNTFLVDGYVYDYVDDSIVGVDVSAQDWYSNEPFQVEMRSTWESDEIRTNKTTHTVSLKVYADSDVWNRTYTFDAPSGWNIVTVTPLDSVDANDWDWGNGEVYVDAGDDDDQFNILLEKEGAVTPPDDEEEEEEEGTTNLLTQTFLGLPVWLWLVVIVGILFVGNKQGWFKRRR